MNMSHLASAYLMKNNRSFDLPFQFISAAYKKTSYPDSSKLYQDKKNSGKSYSI